MSILNLSLGAWDVVLGASAGYAAFSWLYETPKTESNDTPADVRQNFDPIRFANKTATLVQRGVQPAYASDVATAEALRDGQLKATAFADMRRPDLRAVETGVAATAAQRLMWLKRFYQSDVHLSESEPEDVQ
jgi:hypothetical protein